MRTYVSHVEAVRTNNRTYDFGDYVLGISIGKACPFWRVYLLNWKILMNACRHVDFLFLHRHDNNTITIHWSIGLYV